SEEERERLYYHHKLQKPADIMAAMVTFLLCCNDAGQGVKQSIYISLAAFSLNYLQTENPIISITNAALTGITFFTARTFIKGKVIAEQTSQKFAGISDRHSE